MIPWALRLLWIGGAAWVAVGVALLAWGLFADRSRGRRRCPRCWYELGPGAGLTCPECGRAARREGALRRTRRHWRVTVLAVLMLAAAASALVVPRVRRDGWWWLVPTTALILAREQIGNGVGWRQGARDELLERLDATATPDGELWGWQWRLLLEPIIDAGGARTSLDVRACYRAAAGDAFERAGLLEEARAMPARASVLMAERRAYLDKPLALTVSGSHALLGPAAARVVSVTAEGEPVSTWSIGGWEWFFIGGFGERRGPVVLVIEIELGLLRRDGSFLRLGRESLEEPVIVEPKHLSLGPPSGAVIERDLR